MLKMAKKTRQSLFVTLYHHIVQLIQVTVDNKLQLLANSKQLLANRKQLLTQIYY